MIDPTKQVEVNFLFMILNNDPVGQANVLSEIMGFLSKVKPKELKDFFNYTCEESILNFLNENF